MASLSFAEGVVAQANALTSALPRIQGTIEREAANWFSPDDSVLFCGIGASHAALATPVHELRARGRAAFRVSGGEVPPHAPRLADIVVGVSQSGRSRETVWQMQQVDRERRVGLVNASPSPLTEVCDRVLDLGGVPDSAMSSAAFTATLAALGILVDSINRPEVPAEWAALPAMVADWSATEMPPLVEFAADCSNVAVFDIVGAAQFLSAAEQGALLFREGPAIPSMASDTRSYLHGPMDCAGNRTAHVLIGGQREAELADQLAEKDAPILLVTADEASSRTARVLRIPDLPATQAAIIQTVVMQRLVLEVAALRRVDVDARAFTRVDTKVDTAAAAMSSF